jgi:hypothetical protein
MQVLWLYQIYGIISGSSSIGICGGGRSSGSSVLKSPRPMSRQSNHSQVMTEVFASELSPAAHLLSLSEHLRYFLRISKRSTMLKSHTYKHTYVHTNKFAYKKVNQYSK